MGAGLHVELHALVLLERAVALRLDGRVVDEDVRAAVLGGAMKPKPFSALNHFTMPVGTVILLMRVLRPRRPGPGESRWPSSAPEKVDKHSTATTGTQ